jgi:hypothetical protein
MAFTRAATPRRLTRGTAGASHLVAFPLAARTVEEDAPLLISIELDDARMGRGACSHPLLHCHLGRDHEHQPQLRGPFPAMKPWEALDWLLSQIIFDFEPAPWPG